MQNAAENEEPVCLSLLFLPFLKNTQHASPRFFPHQPPPKDDEDMTFEMEQQDVDAFLEERRQKAAKNEQEEDDMEMSPDQYEQMKQITLPGFRQFAADHNLIERLRHPTFFRNLFVYQKAACVRLIIKEIGALPASRANSTSMDTIYRAVADRVRVLVSL
jgi:hypothetical protein